MTKKECPKCKGSGIIEVKKVDSIQHKHDWGPIHSDDLLRSKCRVCGLTKETNPYTGDEEFEEVFQMIENKMKEVKQHAEFFECKCPEDIKNGKGGYYHLVPIDCVTTKEEADEMRKQRKEGKGVCSVVK